MIIKHKEREFELKELDGILLLRVLRVLGKVVERSDGALPALLEVFGSKDGAGENMVMPLFGLISSIEDDDLLKLAAALFQFRNEAEGVKYFSEGLDINALMQAISANIDLTTNLVTALGSFFKKAAQAPETVEA